MVKKTRKRKIVTTFETAHRGRRATQAVFNVPVGPDPTPRGTISLFVEFDSAGLARLEIPVQDFDWVPITNKPIIKSQMPHRLVAIQINLPDGTTKILR